MGVGEIDETEPGDNADPGYKRWSQTAVYCYTTEADCQTCDIAQFYGRQKDAGCHMPKAVTRLLERIGEPPAKLRFEAVGGNLCKTCGTFVSTHNNSESCQSCAQKARYTKERSLSKGGSRE
jgi:rubrerythrin